MHHPPDIPATRDLVLVGGGHAHALVLLRWAMRPLPGARMTLVDPAPAAPYTGMLPGLIAGHYRRDEIMIDLVRLAARCGARLILDRAAGLDPAARVLRLERRGDLAYDILSIDIGIGSGLPDVPGFADHAVAAKPLGPYAARWQVFAETAPQAPRMVVIGAGLGGAELALASVHRLRQAGRSPGVTLVERGGEALAGIGRAARRRLLAELAQAGVTILTGAEPAAILADAVILADGRRLPSDFTLSVAGARPQGWLGGTGLHLTDGFLTVDGMLRTSDPQVFAAGDCAHLAFAPRPRAGVFAVRAAPVLAQNLRAALSGGAMRAFRPQADYLKLVSLGDRRAMADRRVAGVALAPAGGWAWAWKDRIDRDFMARFAPRPVPPPAPLPEAAEGRGDLPTGRPCGGCGAKLGRGVLEAGLCALPALARADILTGPGDDAAILDIGGRRQALTTDHLRALTQDAALMARIAAVHALGDIWAMGAAPQAALAQVILPRLSPALAARDLAAVMAAAGEVFRAAGAGIAGGHSTAGAEFTLGFTVAGLLAPGARAVPATGALPGDALILTKPIGSGTVMAALMADAPAPPGLILGEAVAAAFAAMLRPMDRDAAILAPVARAMTDVTGFGLAGHLAAMAGPDLGADLSRAALPVLPGAEALAAAGIASTLAPENLAALAGRFDPGGDPRAALLVDPQTCGGLLAALPSAEAAAVLDALRAEGIPAVRIGTVTGGSPRIVLSP